MNYYDRNGIRITSEEWISLFSNKDYQLVAKWIGSNDILVSTVWLGIDHGFSDSSEPIIFESMVFRNGIEIECQRYSTDSEAMVGHSALVARYKINESLPKELSNSRWDYVIEESNGTIDRPTDTGNGREVTPRSRARKKSLSRTKKRT